MLRFKTIRVYYFDMMLLNSDCVVFTECWQQEPSVPLVKGPSPPQSVYEVDMVSYAKLIYEHSNCIYSSMFMIRANSVTV